MKSLLIITLIFSQRDQILSESHHFKEHKVVGFLESIHGNSFNFRIKDLTIRNFIENLKENKACGFVKVSYEFFKYGIFDNLIRILKSLFENMISFGFIPKNFHIAIFSFFLLLAPRGA